MSYLGPSLRRRARVSRRWRRIAVALMLSVALNALVLTRVDVNWMRPPPPGAIPKSVDLAPLSPQQWAANRAVTPEGRSRPGAPPAAPVAPPAPKPPQQAPGQVVETAPGNERAPKDSKYVSERNNTVEKETRSRHVGTGGPGAPGPRGAPQPPPSPPAVAERAGPKSAPKGDGEAAREPVARAERGRVALAPGPRADVPATPPSDREAQAGAAPGQPDASPEGPLARLNLRPSVSDYERIAGPMGGGGGGGSPDHIEGVEEGEGTFLNTREWKYAGYFNRIKQAVAERWAPGPALVARDPNGAKFGYKDWHTLLSVHLDGAGALKAVSVAQSSGLDFLDRTAIEAFRAAQPFNNPPPGLADERGDIAFTFGFYLQMGSPGLRLFRGAPPN